MVLLPSTFLANEVVNIQIAHLPGFALLNYLPPLWKTMGSIWGGEELKGNTPCNRFVFEFNHKRCTVSLIDIITPNRLGDSRYFLFFRTSGEHTNWKSQLIAPETEGKLKTVATNLSGWPSRSEERKEKWRWSTAARREQVEFFPLTHSLRSFSVALPLSASIVILLLFKSNKLFLLFIGYCSSFNENCNICKLKRYVPYLFVSNVKILFYFRNIF